MTATEHNPDRWIQQLLPLVNLVKRLAGHLMLRLQANVELEDLVQVGLLDAARGVTGKALSSLKAMPASGSGVILPYD